MWGESVVLFMKMLMVSDDGGDCCDDGGGGDVYEDVDGLDDWRWLWWVMVLVVCRYSSFRCCGILGGRSSSDGDDG